MRRLAGLIALLALGCAMPRATGSQNTSVWVRSHNASEVETYLLCGDKDARWLGVVPEKGTAAFDLPASLPWCPWGLNFFLVVRAQGRGYWAGPVRPLRGGTIQLVIEKYAGLSTARLVSVGR